jgi:hypothetical protein
MAERNGLGEGDGESTMPRAVHALGALATHAKAIGFEQVNHVGEPPVNVVHLISITISALPT